MDKIVLGALYLILIRVTGNRMSMAEQILMNELKRKINQQPKGKE